MLVKSLGNRALPFLHVGMRAVLDRFFLFWERRFASKGIPGLVSIPIATFDRVDVLAGRTLPNLLGQSYSNIEIIVVSDGGPPTLAEAVGKISDPRVRFVQLKNRSRYPVDPLSLWFVAGSRPRNVGSRLARGEFLLWMSDDDVLAPGAISNLVGFLRRHQSFDAVGGTVEVGGANPVLNQPGCGAGTVGYNTGAMPGWLHRRYLKAFRWSTQSWRKSWNRPADYDLFQRMSRLGIRFGYVNDLVSIQLDVGISGKVGSQAAVWEEIRRREQRLDGWDGE